MNKHNIHKRLKNQKYISNRTISRKCHFVIFQLYLIASKGSISLSITAHNKNLSLTESIIHGIIKNTNHIPINVQYRIIHRTHFQILSRVNDFQNVPTFASIHLINANENARVHSANICDRIL